jgi:hypothetical protein
MKKYILILILFFSYSPQSKADYIDVIMEAAGVILTYIQDEIRELGEKLIARLDNNSARAQSNARKMESEIATKNKMDHTKLEMKKYVNRNIGSGRPIRFPVQGPNGRPVLYNLKVSGIASSVCIAGKNSEANKDINHKKAYWNEYSKDFAKTRFSLDEENNDLNISKLNDVNSVAYSDEAKELKLINDKTTIINPEGNNLNIYVAKSLKFAYKDSVPLNVSNMSDDTRNVKLSQSGGNDWLASNFASDAIYKSVFNRATQHFSIDVPSDGSNRSAPVSSSQAIEDLKDYHYANSFKRTMADQVKYESGNLMEMNYLLSRQLNAKINENNTLREQRKMLLIMAIKRLRDMREGF